MPIKRRSNIMIRRFEKRSKKRCSGEPKAFLQKALEFYTRDSIIHSDGESKK